MLQLAIILFIISLVAGFSGVSAATAGVAKSLFYITLAVFLIVVLLAMFAGLAIL